MSRQAKSMAVIVDEELREAFVRATKRINESPDIPKYDDIYTMLNVALGVVTTSFWSFVGKPDHWDVAAHEDREGIPF